jgi:hypothetical protein
MKKFNWGWGIAMLYTAFALFILFLVYKTTTVNIDLVTPDYYKKELAYQEQINKVKRTSKLTEPLQWTVSNRKVTLTFPKQTTASRVKASVLFYRPSDSSKDFKIEVSPDTSGSCIIVSEKLSRGIYRMQVDWSVDGVAYYNEGVVNIN